MIFPGEWIIYINGVLVIWFLITLYRGYQRGFLLQLVDLCGTLVSLFAAWIFAPVFVRIYQFVNIPGNGVVTIDQLLMKQINILIWFVILFVVVRLLMMLVTPLATLISKVPLVKQVNSAVGGVFSIVFFVFKLLLITLFLTTPVIKNGQDIINGTWLKQINAYTEPVFKSMDQFVNKNEAIQNIILKRKLSDDQEEAFAKWLMDSGFNEREIKEFMNKYE